MMMHPPWHMPQAPRIAIGAQGSEFVDHCVGSHVFALQLYYFVSKSEYNSVDSSFVCNEYW